METKEVLFFYLVEARVHRLYRKRRNKLKSFFHCLFLCLLVIFLVACSEKNEMVLTRVDVQHVANDHFLEDEEMILDIVTLDSINSLLGEVEWKPKEEFEAAGEESLIATLFYTQDQEKQDELHLYRIWYNSDDSLSIISNNNEESYGILKEKYADKLKELLESPVDF